MWATPIRHVPHIYLTSVSFRPNFYGFYRCGFFFYTMILVWFRPSIVHG